MKIIIVKCWMKPFEKCDMNYEKKNFYIEYLVFSIIRNVVSKMINGFYVTLV